MQKQLNEAIEKFKNSQTTLEAYEAISDFAKIIETRPEFIKQVQEEGEKNRIAQEENNDDKGWNYGLSGRELKEHNELRAQRHDSLFQLDPWFPLVNLGNVYHAMQSENIAQNSNWLFRRSKPDEPMRKTDRNEYQGFIDKTYKKIVQFLEKEETEEIPMEIILPKEKSALTEVVEEVIDMGLDFNSEKNSLYFKGYKIKVSDNINKKTKGHLILEHIFNSDEELSDEYPLKEIAEAKFGDNYENPNSYKKYHHGCEYLNEKIRKVTGFEQFLICTTGASATVKINEKYLG